MALILGLIAASATSVEAAVTQGPGNEISTAVYVMNNYRADVRVYAEDAAGKLHRLGRVARGDLKAFDVPEALTGSEFRIKVIPGEPVWSDVADDYAVRTNTLVAERDHQVRLWLESNLAQSVVEIDRS